MKIYAVGGAVRDQLLGLPVQDRDYVVVGASPQAMLDAGFKPVGQDFPVFLHPQSHEEYALARTERKVAPGYAGFSFQSSPDVTLEQDLQRRDLTINAIAQAEDGTLIDPYGGQADLRARMFRHVSEAFAEDPVRILRVARFAARFAEFSIAPQTYDLMCAMVNAGEVDALVPERVWQEISRGLMQIKPSRMFEVLIGCGALARLAPELSGASGHWMKTLDAAAASGASLAVRFALWAQALRHPPDKPGPDEHAPDEYAPDGHSSDGHSPNDQATVASEAALEALSQLCQRLRVPTECRTLALLALNNAKAIARAHEASAGEQLRLLTQADGFRKPERFEELLQVVRLEFSTGRPEDQRLIESALARLRQSLAVANAVDSAKAAQAVDGKPSTSATTRGEAIKLAVQQARLQAIEGAQKNRSSSLRKRQRFWKRLIRAPFAIVAALLLGFIDWLWNPLLMLMTRLGRFWVFRALEGAISRLPPYGALLVFAVPAVLLLPFKFLGLYLIGHGQKLAGMAVFVLAKVVGTAMVARVFSLTAPKLMTLSWFNRLYNRFKAYKTRLYELVFEHPWIRLSRRLTRRWLDQIRAQLRRFWRPRKPRP
jgi:tRNA nucleotidyltransferase (CCA-adding enzyme)